MNSTSKGHQISIKDTIGSHPQASLNLSITCSPYQRMCCLRGCARCSENLAFLGVISGSKPLQVSQRSCRTLRESSFISNLSLLPLRWKHSNRLFPLPELHKSAHCRSYHVFFPTGLVQIIIEWSTENRGGEMYLVTDVALKT